MEGTSGQHALEVQGHSGVVSVAKVGGLTSIVDLLSTIKVNRRKSIVDLLSSHHLDLSVTACYTMPGMHERIGQGPLCSWLVFGLLSSQDMAEVFAASCCLRSAKLWNGADGR